MYSESCPQRKEAELKAKKKEANRKAREDIKAQFKKEKDGAVAKVTEKVQKVEFDNSKFNYALVFNPDACREKYVGREKREFVPIAA